MITKTNRRTVIVRAGELTELCEGIDRCGNIDGREGNTVVSAYTTYRHLQQYCSHPSICVFCVLISAFLSVALSLSLSLSLSLCPDGWPELNTSCITTHAPSLGPCLINVIDLT